jgi:Tfp pilus assembly protein PilF
MKYCLVLLCLLPVAGSPAGRASAPPELPPAVRAVEGSLRQNRYGDAIVSLNAAIQNDPHADPLVWLLLARCYEKTNQPDSALRALRAGLAAHPASAEIKRNLGEILFRLQPNGQEAGALLAEASAALPHDAEVRHFYASWAYLNDKEDECVANERTALALPGLNSPALLQIYTLLALCEDKLNHAAAAEQAFQKALQINRSLPAFDAAAAMQYARALNIAGKGEQAARLVEEIAFRVPSFGPAHLEIAKRFQDSGQCAKAADEAQLALAGQGNDNLTRRAARSVLAKCLYALGRKEEA